MEVQQEKFQEKDQLRKINKKKKFVADGVFHSELHSFLSKSLQDAGYAGIEIRTTPLKTEVKIKATQTQNVFGPEGRRIKELQFMIQKRYGYNEKAFQLTADAIKQKSICAQAQAESLKYKLLNQIPLRVAASSIIRTIMRDDKNGAKGVEIIISGKLKQQRAKSMKFRAGYMIHSGQPNKDNIDQAVRHVFFKQGIMGVQIKIMLPYDPTGKFGCKKPIPDNVTIYPPVKDDQDREIRGPQDQQQQQQQQQQQIQ